MESSYIPILESFPLLSEVMPYFGSPDKSFIVLSELSLWTRKNLIKHYPEFRRFMLKYSKTLNIAMNELSEMKIPFDLFKFEIDEDELVNGIEPLIDLLYTICFQYILDKYKLKILL